MADVSHELGSLRHIVGSPLSSKVAMFNKVADQHNESQLLNPFSNVRGSSPARPTFSKDEYGKPLAGSLTEMRGQKANIHVCKEMLELCEIICQEGFAHPEDKDIKVIFFGDLFNIYNHVNDKCVGLLLRARKHKLVDFEGEILFQRRDDEVPILTTKPIAEIRKYIHNKTEEYRRSVSPAPRATSEIIDNMRRCVSQTPSSSPCASKAGTPRSMSPQPDGKVNNEKVQVQNMAKPEPTMRHARSTPAINIVGTENPSVKVSIPESKSEIKPEVKNNNNNKTENQTESKGSPKVTIFLTKAPVVETDVIIEEQEESNDINKEDIKQNSEPKNGILKNNENVDKNVSNSIKLPENNKKNNETIVIVSELSDNKESVKVQSDTVKNDSQSIPESKNEIQSNSEEEHKQVTPVIEPTKTESKASEEAKKSTEVTGKPPTGLLLNGDNEKINSPDESKPKEQQPNNNSQ